MLKSRRSIEPEASEVKDHRQGSTQERLLCRYPRQKENGYMRYWR